MKSLFSLMLFSIILSACGNNTDHSIKRIYIEPWEPQIGFAQMVQHNGMLYFSGVTATGESMQEQVDRIYTKIRVMLEGQGLDFSNVIKENIFTTDMLALKNSIAVRKKYYMDSAYPASSWIEVKGLFMPDMMVEVEIEVSLKK